MNREWWPFFYEIAAPILVGLLVSCIFYFSVVIVPEDKKRRVIKNNLRQLYTDIKRDILYEIISASCNGGRTDLEADGETVGRLLTIEGFQEAFRTRKNQQGNEGFSAFLNYIEQDVPEYREIVLNLQIISKQIDFLLQNYPIHDQQVFDFFKRLERFLIRFNTSTHDDDEKEQLSKFIWNIFGGYSFIEKNRDYDIIEKMIEDI